MAGVAGAGKSAAIDTLADLGFFTVENLPVPLFHSFVDFLNKSGAKVPRAAVSLDIDSRIKQEQLLTIMKALREQGRAPTLVFLDCKSEIVVKRYGQTRRPHPGFDPQKDRTLEDAILREKQQLLPIREIANLVIDTSELNVHELRREITVFAQTLSPEISRTMRINFLSFGFKHGLPIDCDLVVDVRFLPNPYFVDALREHTGLDLPVVDFVRKTPELEPFLEQYTALLATLVPLYRTAGKSYLNVGVGCTGGRHRSVVVATELARRLAQKVNTDNYLVGAKHRDIEKPQ